MAQWNNTSYPGIRYREHPTRKYGKRPDRYYVIRYRIGGKRFEEPLGWASEQKEGWVLGVDGVKTLNELKQNHKLGEGPRTLKQKRELEDARIEAENQEKERQKKEIITFGQFFKDTYLPTSKMHKKTKTSAMEDLHFRLWINPVLGDKPLKAIKPFDLERLKKKLLDKDKSPRTVQYVFATFRQAWNMARRDGLVTEDSPTRKVKLPKIDNKRERFLTVNEEVRLLEEIKKRDSKLHDLTLLSLRTGMRASEIFNLKWSRVDIENGRILIADAKGNKGRAAFMTNDVQAMFKGMKQQGPDDYVFTEDGKKYSEVPWIFRRIVSELELNAGIKDPRQRVCFHTCRHTFASRLAESGVDLYTIKTLLGHSTISLTERYSHLTEGTLQGAIRTLDRSMNQLRTEEKTGTE